MKKREINDVLSKIQCTIGVVTLGQGGVENGLTVSWVSQVSFEPPQIAFAIARKHYSADLLRDSPGFVLNLLGEEQAEVAAHFAEESMIGEDKLEGLLTWEAGSGAPGLQDALAYFDCEVVAIHDAGDHLLVVGEVKDAGVMRDGVSLRSGSGQSYRYRVA